MLKDLLQNHRIILASGSPRRQHFFKELGIEAEIRLKPVEEIYPDRLYKFEISDYLAQLKALPYKESLEPKDILITSDTIVWHDEKALGKPRHPQEAKDMLRALSGKTHEVITSVCFTTTTLQKTVNCTTSVTFSPLDDSEIDFYVDCYAPLDKAGAYGIQEWIGLIGIEEIKGSYFNVVGLPTHLVYKNLKLLANRL